MLTGLLLTACSRYFLIDTSITCHPSGLPTGHLRGTALTGWLFPDSLCQVDKTATIRTEHAEQRLQESPRRKLSLKKVSLYARVSLLWGLESYSMWIAVCKVHTHAYITYCDTKWTYTHTLFQALMVQPCVHSALRSFDACYWSTTPKCFGGGGFCCTRG